MKKVLGFLKSKKDELDFDEHKVSEEDKYSPLFSFFLDLPTIKTQVITQTKSQEKPKEKK